MLLSLLFVLMTDSIPQSPPDSLAVDSLRKDTQVVDSLKTDTLREVTVDGGPSPVSKAIGRNIEAWKKSQPKVKSLGDVLEKLSPGINDKITHPFAIKQRKMERRRKRTKQILKHYDQVKTFDELLRESIEQQKLEEEEKTAQEGGEK